VSYSEQVVAIFDSESGQELYEMTIPNQAPLKSDLLDEVSPIISQINRIVIDASRNLLIAGTEDLKLQFFDLQSRKLVKTVVGHTDGISCLDILPSRLTGGRGNLLVSGGHDGAVRVWDL
jgi:WD40 repeat protein